MSAALAISATIDPRRLPGMRRQLGLTQTELAQRIGVRSDEICRLERALAPGELLDMVIDGLTASAQAQATD